MLQAFYKVEYPWRSWKRLYEPVRCWKNQHRCSFPMTSILQSEGESRSEHCAAGGKNIEKKSAGAVVCELVQLLYWLHNKSFFLKLRWPVRHCPGNLHICRNSHLRSNILGLYWTISSSSITHAPYQEHSLLPIHKLQSPHPSNDHEMSSVFFMQASLLFKRTCSLAFSTYAGFIILGNGLMAGLFLNSSNETSGRSW